MAVYESFARVYDELMDDVPYEAWSEFITRYLKEKQIEDGLVLELGCGTGKLMELMAAAGYDMIGVDSSIDMLQIAREKATKDPQAFLYLHQDMREFELYGTVRAVVSICDSINYILDEQDLETVFSLVNNYLDPGGYFIFDFNTQYKYRDVIGDDVIAEDRDDVSFIWYNQYDSENNLNYIDLNVFVREEDGRYQKFQEEHVQKGYTLTKIKTLLKNAGLIFIDAFDGYTKKAASLESERVVVIARENGK